MYRLQLQDDMRPSIGAYGLKEAVTPHLDQLAKEGVMFTRAHIQFSYCAPSRNSFMSGRRPDATKVWNFNNHFRQIGKDWIALPEQFVTNGYLVTGVGKLYHPGVPPNFDQPRSWSATAPDGSAWPYMEQGNVNGTNLASCGEDHCCGAKDPHYCLRDLEPGESLL
jgi:iduronate 2-sulfatase